ncbi:MAG: saccharopine dehydrogenase NADP-binding domain-containing protein, partial [Planctomycetales bacterium]|nr:saccharopine dehydrogenase NADP-binding domain-containing protein [Planctomycetales bacterium]
MTSVLLLGAGKIGRMITHFLTETEEYSLTIADADPQHLQRIAASHDLTTTALDAND